MFFMLMFLVNIVGSNTQGSISSTISLSKEDIDAISRKIYFNETRGNDSHLLYWNKNEDFLSLGIGHFIWFPRDKNLPFTESFPHFITYLLDKKFPLPTWLNSSTDNPWMNYNDFTNGNHSKKREELFTLLKKSYHLQALFLIERLKEAIPQIIYFSSDKKLVEKNFFLLSNSPNGVYAMIDYVNFKGEGISVKERYEGSGWGLLQVLENMKPDDYKPVESFIAACKDVLQNRVSNSPDSKKKQETAWLLGWERRLASYREDIYD